ncbi:uncharacterized protein N7459_000039 [Penicillium hispanicum]|uniref:uncharacterized protein n=1 Tax=Penicillium hispanicum TaxID=1080232 RepID=UPI00254211D3|nr:uncharacterized protein N7459_000039 [Penicillium hispanicum]KAJ5593831.1 hypothetical protein N7459_000039 [Penicillium hispanicum]
MLARFAAMAASGNIYRLAGLGGIVVGQQLTPNVDSGANDTQALAESWGLRSGVYTPRQLVEGFAPLLDAIVFRLGSDSPGSKPARARLLDNLTANLATDTREATLRLSEPLDVSRREINQQAIRIGKSLVQWARESHSESFDPEMYLRSPCEGHLLIPSNVDLMFGDRSEPHLMQLFNEYMHQMVLLRDALLPFQNYEDVIIPIGGKARGIRHLEPARNQFLAEILTKHTTQRSVVTYAKALLAPGLLHSTVGGYGFQYAHGTVLPAFLSGGPTPLHLLQYIPAKLDPNATDTLFDYQFQDYYSAPRGEIPAGTQSAVSDLRGFPEPKSAAAQSASIGVVNDEIVGPARRLELRLELDDGKCAAVDLGQIARGHRYSYLAQELAVNRDGTARQDSALFKPAVVHDAIGILESTDAGLLGAKEGGFHIIPTKDSLVALALLGKLYPENVILLPRDEELGQAEQAGKGFEPKFVVWGGARRGGLKGVF